MEKGDEILNLSQFFTAPYYPLAGYLHREPLRLVSRGSAPRINETEIPNPCLLE